MNLLITTGNLGGDSELKWTASENPVLGFSVGTTKSWGNKKKTEWIKCSLWGKRAESLHPYLKKGVAVTVTGEASLYVWENEDKHGASIQVNVSEVILHGGKPDSDKPAQTGFRDKPKPDFDDDIPF